MDTNGWPFIAAEIVTSPVDGEPGLIRIVTRHRSGMAAADSAGRYSSSGGRGRREYGHVKAFARANEELPAEGLWREINIWKVAGDRPLYKLIEGDLSAVPPKSTVVTDVPAFMYRVTSGAGISVGRYRVFKLTEFTVTFESVATPGETRREDRRGCWAHWFLRLEEADAFAREECAKRVVRAKKVLEDAEEARDRCFRDLERFKAEASRQETE